MVKRFIYYLLKGLIRMTFQEVFEEIKSMFMNADVSDIKERVAFQFNMTGEGSGIFYAEIKDGKVTVEPYSYDDRDVQFTCSADTLLKIAKGKMNPITAFTFGKIKIDGALEKALVLQKLI